MLFINFFLGTCWVAAFGVIWFCTDWFIHYSQLLGCFENIRLKYLGFIANNPDKYFPDFLYKQSLQVSNRYAKFVLKLASCPFCLLVWISTSTAYLLDQIILAAPIYLASLLILLVIKKLM